MTVPSLMITAMVVMCAFTSAGFGQAQTEGQQQRGGIGIAIAPQAGPNGEAVIAGVKPDGPAARAGVAAGDLLVSVETRTVAQIGLDALPNVVSGPAGTTVNIVVVTPGQQPRKLTIQREAGIVIRQADPNATAPNGSQLTTPPANGPAVNGTTAESERSAWDPFAPAPAGPGAPPTAGPIAPGIAGQRTLKLRPYVIRDPAVNNVVMCAPLVPEGWQVQGGVEWLHNLAILTNLRLDIRDPRSGAGVRWLPPMRFYYMPNPPVAMTPGQNYMGRLFIAPPRDPAAFVADFYAQQLPELRGVAPYAVDQFPRDAANTLRTMGGPGANGQSASSLRLRYRVNEGGQQWDEDVYVTLGFMPVPAIGSVDWFVKDATVVRAPAGQIDRMPELSVIRGSAEVTPEWSAGYALVQRIFSAGLKADLDASVALGQQLAQMRAEQQQLSQQLYNDRMASADARNAAFRETLGGVENYRDPIGNREVYLPAGYNDYFVNSKGEYLITDTPNVDPNVGSTERWQKMDRIDPMAGRGRQ